MVQPSSGDDYYSKIGPSAAATPGHKDAKVKLKIVAKKSVAHPTPAPVVEEKPHEIQPETIIEKPLEKPRVVTPPPIEEEVYNPQNSVLDAIDPTPSSTEKKKILESGTLDLGAKYISRPSVVFHTHADRPQVATNVPHRGTFRTGTPGPNRPRFNNDKGASPSSGGGRPGFRGSAAGGGGAAGFRKPDAPRKNYKPTKKGKKHKLAFLKDEKEDMGTFHRQKQVSGVKQEKDISSIRQTLVSREGQEVEMGEFCTVKEFSDKIGIALARIIGELLKNGIIVNLNSQIDFDTCFLIAEGFHIHMKKVHSIDSNMADLMDGNIEALLAGDEASEKVIRPPIISVMGHVDHGKTSILDSIRKTDVASGEAGGITQKIGAYQVTKNGRQITFLDTPGHEAFALMRSRGAKLTDIIILAVAADEGLKPQTVESINLAKEAGVPVVVAINKIDKPGADPEKVKRELADQGLTPEDWGGDTICVPCSAKTGEGIDKLLEMVLLVADMKQLKSHPTRPGIGTVIESHLDPGQGVVATILVNAGIFSRGDAVFCGVACGKIRTMKDSNGKNIPEATSSMPVQITGLDEVPDGGQIIQVFPTLDAAREKSQSFKLASSSKSVNKFEQASLANLIGRLKTGTLQHLKIVLKADSNGSLEALKSSLSKITAKDVAVRIIHAGIGAVNESDVLMAGTSAALLIAFNVPVVGNATDLLSKSKIEFITDKVIYRIIEKVESIATGMIDIKYDQVLIGEGKILKIFYTGEGMMIVGLSVVSGNIQKRAQAKIIRHERVAGSGIVENLKEGVYEVNQVEEGKECGIQFKGDTRIVEGDKLEFYMTVERK